GNAMSHIRVQLGVPAERRIYRAFASELENGSTQAFPWSVRVPPPAVSAGWRTASMEVGVSSTPHAYSFSRALGEFKMAEPTTHPRSRAAPAGAGHVCSAPPPRPAP